MGKIQAVMVCGGSRTRVWPESRESLPKQFIPLIGDRSTGRWSPWRATGRSYAYLSRNPELAKSG